MRAWSMVVVAFVVMVSGCAGSPAPEPTVMASASAASSDGASPGADTQPAAAQIRWIDDTITYADPDAGGKVFNLFSNLNSSGAPRVKYDALITAAKVTEKNGEAVYTFTIDEVTPSDSGDETDLGYVNPSRSTRKITVTDPLILVFPPNVVTPMPKDFVAHVKEFDQPFSFYDQGGVVIAAVEWYHP